MGTPKTGKLGGTAWELPQQKPPEEFAKADEKRAIACTLGRHVGTVGACLFQSRQYQFECHLAHGHGPNDAYPGQYYKDAMKRVKGGSASFSDLAKIQKSVTALITNAIAKLFHGKMTEAKYACPKECPWLISGPHVTVQFTPDPDANERGQWKGVVTIEFSCAADEDTLSVARHGVAGLSGREAQGVVVSVARKWWKCRPNERGWLKICVAMYGHDVDEEGAQRLLDRRIRQEMNHYLHVYPCDPPCETRANEPVSDPGSYSFSRPAGTAFLCMHRDVWCEEVQGWSRPDLPPPVDEWEYWKYRKRRERGPVAATMASAEHSVAEPEWQAPWDLRRRLEAEDVVEWLGP